MITQGKNQMQTYSKEKTSVGLHPAKLKELKFLQY